MINKDEAAAYFYMIEFWCGAKKFKKFVKFDATGLFALSLRSCRSLSLRSSRCFAQVLSLPLAKVLSLFRSCRSLSLAPAEARKTYNTIQFLSLAPAEAQKHKTIQFWRTKTWLIIIRERKNDAKKRKGFDSISAVPNKKNNPNWRPFKGSKHKRKS